ncbi:carbohydrate ABC transporter permease [Niameybacter massiliensis]|uniref:Carbohydrate ABC transporter permease n=1 Tax=Holtiella tumoricola TaxID=3018743 RepID=A0AA42DNG1_9FIRM|nr:MULTISPECIES: carbohydrate ABC transporter permease [Lachnospirales]MDA3732517.1 carbohydrate ABC transporter permease [Holtiella tumoricola]
MKNLIKMKEKKQLALAPAYLLLIVWTVFIFIMIGWVVLASFSTTKEIFNGTMLKFESGINFVNYKNALFSHNVAKYFMNSVIYTCVASIGVILVGAPASYALARARFKGRSLCLNMFVVGMSIPVIMIILPLYSTLSKLGVTNNRITIIFLYICMTVPFTVFFLYSFFQSLPGDFEEAAAIDGCGPIKTFWSIMFPLAQPGVITLLVFNFITIWNEYFISYILIDDVKLKPVAVGLYSMVQSMKYSGDWAAMFAAVVIVFLPTFILYLFLSDKIIAGVTGGGVKG